MKRALAMGLGALMVAGTAAPAAAASHIDFSGYYRIMYMSETNTGYGREARSFTDSYFQDRLNLDLTFSPTDEISIYWRLRGPGSYQRWGGGDKNLYTQFIYGEIKQDWGTVLIGRMSDDLDCAGLCTFGYMPENIPVYTNVGAFDRGDIMDGVRYSYDWDNGFSILAQYVKLGSGNSASGEGADWDRTFSDEDYDRFQLQGAYAWDGGGVSLHAYYDRNAASIRNEDWFTYDVFGNPDGFVDYNWQYQGWAPSSMNFIADGSPYYTGGNGFTMTNIRLQKTEQWGLNPSIMHSWGDFSVHFEGMATWGQAKYTYTQDQRFVNGVLVADREASFDMDGKGYGAYLDFDYNYGPGNVTLAGWWVSGTDVDEMYDRNGNFNRNAESESIANLVGGNFYPLLVAYNGVNSNPAGNRHYGNAGAKVSAIGFANNAYENYVYEGHMQEVNDLGSYTALGSGVNLVANTGNFVGEVLSASNINRTRTLSFNNGTDANHWAIALTGNHAFTDDISMHYGLAYLGLNKANYRVVKSATYNDTIADPDRWAVNSYTSQDKDLGFEIDLGFTFQLLDNLKFTSAFGYMFNGDAYKQLKGYRHVESIPGSGLVNNSDRIQAVWEDADDSYVWFNSLTFAF